MADRLWIIGLNPFDLRGNSSLQEIDLHTLIKQPDTKSPPLLIRIGQLHAFIAQGKTLFVFCVLTEERKTVEFAESIVALEVSNKYCLILLETGRLLKYDSNEDRTVTLDFLGVEDKGQQSDELDEIITHLSCGEHVAVACSSKNVVYNIPNKTVTFPRHVRVLKIASGFEHSLLLTRNGDVYSWGSGLRGQLGNGEISTSQDQPKLIDALAGVKIVDIAAAGWHSAAVSAFGDLYTWGWNNQGQLGLAEAKFHGRVVSQPQLITFADEQDISVTRVHCGIGHTIVEVKEAGETDESILVAGCDLQTRFQYDRATVVPSFEGFRKLQPPISQKEGERSLEVGTGPYQVYFLQRNDAV
ncbi:RCC1 domain containing 1 [Anopheles darlingi]|uniref:RCC1 domain containing 1 n=1 Tax=Anopheles darlingi TaxID=43151 RepID=W5JB57_ANODA|nr:RCC1 domain containing 1 [Anopheles darlingi]